MAIENTENIELDANTMLSRLLDGAGATEKGLTRQFLAELHNGFRLDSVAELINSQNWTAVDTGAHLISELFERASPLREAALKLATRSDSYHRIVFLNFCSNTGTYDPETLCLHKQLMDDITLNVRFSAIQWACLMCENTLSELGKFIFNDQHYAVKEHSQFDNFDDTYDRAKRAYRIVLLIKSGCTLDNIIDIIKFEDSYTLETIERLILKASMHKKIQKIPLNFMGLESQGAL